MKGRKRAAPILNPIAAFLVKIGVTPTAVTILGLIITLVGAILIAGAWLSLGAFIAAVGVFLDALDGPVARARGKVSDRGAFVDTMSDRFGEIAIWIGLAIYLSERRAGSEPVGVGDLILCLVALAFSLLIPYVRAKAESWGAEGKGGWMGRAERMILAILGIGIAGFGVDAEWGDVVLYGMLWVFVILTGFTVLQRMRKTLQQLPG
jgi:CDP-diacylglycerol--glycerol-3-phosphate 3-phosphatidyltransferase